MSRPDPDLARRFAALRRLEGEGSPPFHRLWSAAGSRRSAPARPWRLAAAGAAVVATALLSAWLVALRVPAPVLAPGPSLSDWRSPTAFLLRTPGQEILEASPELGRGFPLSVER